MYKPPIFDTLNGKLLDLEKYMFLHVLDAIVFNVCCVVSL
jgi:hypothetical protein